LNGGRKKGEGPITNTYKKKEKKKDLLEFLCKAKLVLGGGEEEGGEKD